MVKKHLSRFYMALIYIFLYAPIIVLVINSFNGSKTQVNWGGFTLKWYFELFQDRNIKTALYYTVIVAVLSAIISTVLGTMAAIGIHSLKGKKKALIVNANYLPIVNPDIVTGVALMILYLSFNVHLGFKTMLLSHIAFGTPYVVLSVLPKLKQLNVHLSEAAMDLGATPFYALRKVIIPEIMPGIITGFLMALTLSIDDFVISFFTTGNGVTNLSIVIYSMARRGIKPTINALSTLMLVSVLTLMLIINSRKNSTKNKKIKRNGGNN
ncbi:ABC transporter permease [Sedimentibacter sp. zth1]|uniref:ABC transporter permease n=1 Tax=Sedimentibacter sp. zth1 TaxID=2816908 RepID=UPI001A9302FF|nr:ABC transporter permease [Sedimentibacter sp. zth1]QSX07058.1 ABC transporter permease [Sedimentibacter sp. zth1]